MPKRAVFLLDMSGARSLLLLLAAMATLAQAFPAAQEEDGDSTGPLPLIQFTKGGIRVNFGGYHAQAGLGGLLTGRKADGGLHASAGTPSGAHASAGLGGSLDGGPAGGIHARAGLGNGGPEAEAGLAGSLAGPQPKGEIYAGSSAGNFDVLDKINSIERQKTRGKNIQIISRPQKANELDAAASSAAVANADANSKTKESSSPSSSSSSSSSSSVTTANAGTSSNGDESDEKSKHPARWYYMKRLAERIAPVVNKTSTHDPIESLDQAEAAPDRTTTSTQRTPARQPAWQYGIFARSPDTSGDGGGSGKFKKGTLFDDIFNIPISALNAVNQLLKNHVGKKK